MITKFIKTTLVLAIAAQVLFAQETGQPDEEPELLPAIAEALPKTSVAEVLSSVNLSGSCVADFTSLLEKESFDMAKFMKELPPDVAKTRLKLKSPFGKPKDGDKTDVGLTVGCIKALPESPAELSSLLQGISLKMGLDLAVETAENIVDNSIPTNIPKESGSGGGLFKPITSISLATIGLGAIVYGIMKNSDVSDHVANRNGKAAVDAESSRNISYGIGAALLAGGLVVYLVF
ncbi:MAG: hypothetical protein LBC64_02970 [Fibromonadaceae bacterium]|jgi:hypothetical protein|nr:hypothetical protein [Fibromonadaceae bacterium]